MFTSMVLVAAVGASTLGLGGAVGGPSADVLYPIVAREGLSYTHGAVSDDVLRGVGYSVCESLWSGWSESSVVNQLMTGFNQQNPTDPLTVQEAAYVVGASEAAYCPR